MVAAGGRFPTGFQMSRTDIEGRDEVVRPVDSFYSKVRNDEDEGEEVEPAVTRFTLATSQAPGPAVLSGFLTDPDGIDAGDEFVFGFSEPLISGKVSPDPAIPSPTPTPTLTIITTHRHRRHGGKRVECRPYCGPPA